MDLFVEAQKYLPKKMITCLAGLLASVKYRPLKNLVIDMYIRAYKVDMSEARALSIDQYSDFNAFFARELRPDARPLPDNPRAVISPADGAIPEFGEIKQEKLIQAKGKEYSLAKLLGDDELASELDGGCFATVYLSPKDYHRVHMPLSGKPMGMRYIPGKLFSVNSRTALNLDNLFAINERLVMTFENKETGQKFVLVMVGALIVGGMETVISGPIDRSKVSGNVSFQEATLEKGQELGRFYLGSTAILLCPKGLVKLDDSLVSNIPVKMGQKIGLMQD